MDALALAERIEEVARSLGLGEAVRARLASEAERFALEAAAADSSLHGEVARLREEAEEARARLAALESEVMELLGSQSRKTIIHDLRNVLNSIALRAHAAQEVERPEPEGS